MPGDLERALANGWRVEVDLVNRRWRYARGSKRTRRWTPYYALDSVPGGAERIRKAQEESERQRQARIAARSKR